ncbi:MAG: ketosteroid isomerase family protein [Xanthomonadales bacterium]|nr:ketosteroid isomerase family protein [Xanthomonadales bacterium]
MNVKAFFDNYIKAFDAFDPEAIADLYHYPSLLSSMDSNDALVDRVEAIRNFRRICDSHRRMGYHTAVMLHSDRKTLTENLAVVTVRWRFENESGKDLAQFDCTYTLADHGNGIGILCAVVHG